MPMPPGVIVLVEAGDRAALEEAEREEEEAPFVNKESEEEDSVDGGIKRPFVEDIEDG